MIDSNSSIIQATQSSKTLTARQRHSVQPHYSFLKHLRRKEKQKKTSQSSSKRFKRQILGTKDASQLSQVTICKPQCVRFVFTSIVKWWNWETEIFQEFPARSSKEYVAPVKTDPSNRAQMFDSKPMSTAICSNMTWAPRVSHINLRSRLWWLWRPGHIIGYEIGAVVM